MKQLVNIVADLVSKAIADALDGVQLDLQDIAASGDLNRAHYQCNSAMRFAKQLKLPPRAVAEKILAALSEKEKEPFVLVEIAGAGFINFIFKEAFLANQLEQMAVAPHLGVVRPPQKEKVIVEFSSPNIAKELHVGHLRSTIIGDSLARLFEFLGFDVLRLNHVGDWGTQFGMLIAYMQIEQADVISGKKKTDLSQLMEWYRASKKCFDEDEAFKERAKKQVVLLQSGDVASLAIWQIICEISRKAYQEIYDLLDIRITERGESFYNPQLKGVVEDLEKKGMVTLSDGAKCVFLDGFFTQEGTSLPMIIQKADGGYNYSTTDIAALRHRVDVEKADQIFMVVDSGQSTHFQMFLMAAEKAGYFNRSKNRIEHVGFGVVLGEDGKKFKTRSGDTIRLMDLLTEAIDRAAHVIREKEQKNGQVLSEIELQERAKVLGLDAIKYADLSNERIKDYKFSYNRMLQFEGNTAAFLLYSYVRICSVEKKAAKSDLDAKLELTHVTEQHLALHLLQFSESLELMAKKLMPHVLCTYLYELACKFNEFYRDCQVVGSLQEKSRLKLCQITRTVLETGLSILGLKTIKRM